MWNYRFIDSNLYKKVKEYIRKELYKKNSIKNNVELELLSYNEAKKEYCYSWNCKS